MTIGNADGAKLFHRANQEENRTNTRIANLTAKIAQRTQRDSASMITIAAVTMFFLPGTFISVRRLTPSQLPLRKCCRMPRLLTLIRLSYLQYSLTMEVITWLYHANGGSSLLRLFL